MRYNLDSELVPRPPRATGIASTVPFYSAGNWSGMGLHLRGNTEGYVRAASKHKKLRIHAGTHYHPFYTDGRARRPAALLRSLAEGHRHRHHARAAGEAADPQGRPRQLPSGASRTQWPLARTRWTKFYLRPDAHGDEGETPRARSSPTRRASAARFRTPASGMTKAGVASASWTSTALAGSLPRDGGVVRDRAARRKTPR